ncbi:MAG: class I SAM-dependent methyltransferase [Candidatus Sulfotelmatobacter sp.]|jgi:2-polyprenyl-6-hydroxyphenyl methylase/3-demethylubiquinone-9 3-methyltransferase
MEFGNQQTDAAMSASLALSEQAEYDRRWTTKEYSAGNSGYTPFFLRFMKEEVSRLGPGRKAKALEIGCGDGFFSGHLARLGCEVTGIDLSPAAIDLARKSCAEASFAIHDLTKPLPFDESTMDLVWCSEVLEHLFSPLGALYEIHRLLKLGGVLLCTVPYHGAIKNLGIALFAFDRHYDPTYPHVRFFTRKSLIHIVEQAGLSVESVRTCGSSLGYLGLRDLVCPTNIMLRARKHR